MSWHTLVNFVALGATADTPAPPIPDQVLAPFGNGTLLKDPMKLVGAYASNALLIRAKLDSPTLRFYGRPEIKPINAALLPPNLYPFEFFDRQPFLLPAGEEIDMLLSASGAGPGNAYGLLMLQDTYEPVGQGNIYCVHGSGTTATVAATWSQVLYALDQPLPVGMFELLGSLHYATNAVAHRWIFDAPQTIRPGFPSQATIALQPPDKIVEWPFGVMGRFRNDVLPRFEVISDTADNAHDIFLYVRKIS